MSQSWSGMGYLKLSFPVRLISLLSRRDLASRRAAARSGGDGRSRAARSTASMASTGPSPQ